MSSVSSLAANNQSILQSYIDKQKAAAETSSTSSSKTTSSSDKKTLAADLNTFLNILTTQLKYQDPTSATDTDAFTQQLVQFAQVEQQIQTNEKIDKMIEIGKPNGVTPLLGYVGRTVEAETDGAIAVQSGQGAFTYNLDRLAQSATITVKDSTGKTVATLEGSTSRGENKIVWDAKDSLGKTLADGAYTVSIAAKDSNGQKVETSNINMVAKVTGIETASDGTASLYAGPVSFGAAKIVGVYYG